MRNLLILGGGTAGTMIANKLHKRLPRDEWSITVVDRDDDHHYQPGYLFVPFGGYSTDEIVRSRHHFIHDGVELVYGEVDKVSPDDNAVLLADGRSLPYDYLVIASGTTPRPDQTPGMLGPEWRKSIFDFYTLEGAEALAQALETFDHGRLVVHISEMPIKCPVAPLEFTFLAEAWFREHGVRDRVELTYVTPLDGAFTKPVASEHLGGMLDERKVEVVTDFMIESVDPERKVLVSFDEREVPFDLLVTIPVNMGADFVARSGLGDELNYVPVDKHTLLSTAYDNIFAVGDASNIPTSKAGLGRALRRRDLRRQLPRARRRPADDRVVRRARELLRGVRRRQGAAHRLQLRHRAAAGQVPDPARRPDESAEGDAREPPRQARVPPHLLERAAPRPPDPPPGAHVDGRETGPRGPRSTRQGGMTP